SSSSGVRCCNSGSVISRSYGLRAAGVSCLPVLQVNPQFVAAPVDVGLHRAQGQVEDPGDLFVAVTLDVPQQDAGAVLGAELRDRPLDRAPQLPGLDLLERALSPVAELQRGGAHLFGRSGVR